MITDLYGISGIPVALDGTILLFGEGMEPVEPDPRKLEEYLPVLAPSAELEGPDEAYFMHRGVALTGDLIFFESRGYRYDITVLEIGCVGKEPIKTIGHYHPSKPGTAVSYPEIYEVLHGEASYILQRVEGRKVIDLVLATVKPGEKVVIPPGYGHVTVNTGDGVLAMSNLLESEFKSIYEPYARMRGAAVYKYEDCSWDKNENYEIGSYRKVRPKEIERLGIDFSKPLYAEIKEDPEIFDYVVNPEKYDFEDLWDVIETVELH